MSEITLRKLPGHYLTGATKQDNEYISKLKEGEGIKFKVTKKRNLHMLRKFFALLNHGFEVWEPEAEHSGIIVQKNFEKFRKDITILCGHYHTVVGLDGKISVEADSIAFGEMDERTFDSLYYKAIDVLIEHVLVNYTKEEADHVVEELLKFT